MIGKIVLFLSTVIATCECLEANLEVACVSNEDQHCVCQAPENCIPAEWSPWSPCSVSCGKGGFRARVAPQRPALEEGSGRCPPRVEQQPCSQLPPCRVDCRVSEWESWSECAATCSGESSRRRSVVRQPAKGGAVCPSLYDVRRCPGGVECAADCRTTSWSDWSCCADTALGRLKTRDRLVTVKQAGSGADCPQLRGIADCSEITCGRNPRVGCQDNTSECDEWTKDGHCTRNPGYMLKSCKKSCAVCTDTIAAPAVRPDRCVLLIGGRTDVPPLEFYHPDEGVECNVTDVQMSTERIKGLTKHTSGCYLPEAQQIVIREAQNPDKPPMVYNLKDGSAKEMPLPFQSGRRSYYTTGSTAARIGPHRCLSCGGRDLDATHWFYNNCYEYDSRHIDPRWRPIAPLPHPGLAYAASVTLGQNFYVVGGWNVSERNELFRYNVISGKWHQEKPMSGTRYHHSAVRLSPTEFMVCGGNYDKKSCKRYSETERQWRPTGSLNTGRREQTLVEFQDELYSIGWYATVETYDRQADRWRFVKAAKHDRRAHLAFVL